MTTLPNSRELVVAFLGLAVGCATTKPFKSSGPVSSPEGLRLTLVEQTCNTSTGSGDAEEPLVEVIVHLDLETATQTATIRRESFTLSAGTTSLHTLSKVKEPLVAGPNDSVPIKLRFMGHGLSCTGEMTLNSDAAVELSGGPVALPPIQFVPRKG
jgi:hypothetical protein